MADAVLEPGGLVATPEETATVREVGALVVYGGWNAELDVSIEALSAVRESLESAQVGVLALALNDTALGAALMSDRRCVLNIANGRLAEGGAVAGAREVSGLPFVGSTSVHSALALDKHVSTLLFQADRLPVPGTRYVDRSLGLPAGVEMGKPVVVKPVDTGGGVDAVLCATPAALSEVAEAIVDNYGRCLVQEFLPGREFCVAVVEDGSGEPIALPPVEVFPGDGLMTAEAKYGSARIPARPAAIGRQLLDRLQRLAIRAHALLGLRGYSRTEMRLDPDEVPRLLEINHTPGLGRDSWLPIAAAAAGLDHPDLLVRLLANGQRHLPPPPPTRAVGA